MRTANRKINRLLACALVFLLALTVAVPAFAANAVPNTENLKITIHNNAGLPEMEATQFGVYQLFKGTPHQETTEIKDADWDASQWNNWTLADIAWGSSVIDNGTALLAALKDESFIENNAWAGKDANPFADVTTAAGLAEVLANHNDNAFMQGFADFVMKKGGLKDLSLTGSLQGAGENQTLTYDLNSTGTGYYIFQDKNDPADSDVVSEYIVAVMGTQDIDLKASIPQVDKEIVDGDNDTTEGDVAGVSDYVQFKLIGTLPKNFADFDSYEYTFHDTLSAGLTYVNDTGHEVVVRVYESSDAMKKDTSLNGGTVVNASEYTVTTAADSTIDCSLEVAFADLMKLTAPDLTANSVFVVTYYAQVNENAVIGSTGNPNNVYLEYSNDPHEDGTGKTKEEKVYVYAFGLELNKIGSDNKPLEGAGFLLKKGSDYGIFEGGKLTGWTSATSEPTTDAVTKLIETYHNAKNNYDSASNADRDEGGDAAVALKNAEDALKAYLLKSDKDGKIPDITGLDEGSYELEEVIVPDGYNTPEEDFDIKIEADINKDSGELEKVTYTHDEETVTYKDSYDPAEELPDGETSDNMIAHFRSGMLPDTIVNQKAPFLPFTGGTGTLIIYVLGVALISGAVIYLVTVSKKRKRT